MKKIFQFILLFFMAFYMSACDYLDIVPDEREKEEDAFKDVQAARRFLYSCYAYMPTPNWGGQSLDFMTGDEVVTSFEQEKFANFPKGTFTADKPIISYWNDLFAGIRQCYILRDNVDKVPAMSAATNADYKAQIEFLLGYYHLLLMRCYGPTIIVREVADINVDPSSYLSRSPLNECVEFITEKFKNAANVLPTKRDAVETGLATSVAAKALRAYTLMYYASPLFNGNAKLAAELINPDGTPLLDAAEDRGRWVTARDAYLEAINAAKDAGHDLYTVEEPKMDNKYPENTTLRVLRANLPTIIKYNKEEIWTKQFAEGAYGVQRKSMPYVNEICYNGVCPTMNMLDRFYTVDGLPYDVDPKTKDLNKYDLVTLTAQNTKISFVDGTEATIAASGRRTSLINMGREPRYYAWIAFQSGYYEVTNASTNGGYDGDNTLENNQRIITNFLADANCGRQGRNNNYSPGGFLNKKGVHPDNTISKSNATLKNYPFPLIRLGELYLGYAECCAESGDVTNAKLYLNKIRARAGIPDVDTSWGKAGGITSTKQLRDIIRQERQIELYLECHNFWDMRRWLLADQYFNHKHEGMAITAKAIEQFSQPTEVPFARVFEDRHWLLPIPATDINNNHNVIQNPGY